MSNLPIQHAEFYLGDGLYVSFDGWQIKLRAPRLGGDHFVALEPAVWQSLHWWVLNHPRLEAHLNGDK